jgi:NADH-ubiquinone oxidoreductase chain 5
VKLHIKKEDEIVRSVNKLLLTQLPTPVSALLHAATLVTAGIYLLIRISPILEFSGSVLLIITLIGSSTAFFAATCGLLQNDLKRIIAFSTISQLGYILFF